MILFKSWRPDIFENCKKEKKILTDFENSFGCIIIQPLVLHTRCDLIDFSQKQNKKLTMDEKRLEKQSEKNAVRF